MLETNQCNPVEFRPQQDAATVPQYTVKEIIEMFDREHLSTLKDPRGPRCLLRLYFTPLHQRLFQSLTVIDLVRWSNIIRQSSTVQANACIKLMRNIYNKAIAWQLYHGENLARHLTVKGQSKRETYIREHEMPKVLSTILAQPFPERLYFYQELILAPRPKELQQAKVADIEVWKDAAGNWAGLWRKPKEVMKKGRPHIVPLPPKLAEMYAQYLPMLPQGALWLFPGRKGEPRSKEYWHTRWTDIRRAAGITHIWQYDLRRTGSTWANDTCGDLAAVSRGMLSHHDYQATNHYVQVMDGPVRAMLEKHEERLLACQNK